MVCPHCGSGVVAKKGFSYTKHRPTCTKICMQRM